MMDVMPTDVGILRALLEEELVWHEERDKSLSKQPQSNQVVWRRAEHQERIDVIRAALKGVPQPASEAGKLSSAANDVLAERERQQSGEGWGTDHDDAHDRGEMALAAACYALHSTERGREAHYIHGQWQDNVDLFWDWDRMWWKPKGARRNLVRAAALLIAEIERLDRAEAKLSTDEVKS